MELPVYNTYINFSRHHFCCFTVAPLFVLDKSTSWNRYLQHPCFKKLCRIAQTSKISYSNAQHFLSDLLRHSCSLHSQVTNSLMLSWIGLSTLWPKQRTCTCTWQSHLTLFIHSWCIRFVFIFHSKGESWTPPTCIQHTINQYYTGLFTELGFGFMLGKLCGSSLFNVFKLWCRLVYQQNHQACPRQLYYRMMVERYPNPKKNVGGSIPGCDISSLLHIKLVKWSTASCALALAYWAYVSKKLRKSNSSSLPIATATWCWCSRLRSLVPFKWDLALHDIPLSKQAFKAQSHIENEDVTWSPQRNLPGTRTSVGHLQYKK